MEISTFDHPMPDDQLNMAADYYKSLGGADSVPFKGLFAGQQSKEFYLGMLCALSMVEQGITQVKTALDDDDVDLVIKTAGLEALEQISDPTRAWLIHATLLAHEKQTRIIPLYR